MGNYELVGYSCYKTEARSISINWALHNTKSMTNHMYTNQSCGWLSTYPSKTEPFRTLISIIWLSKQKADQWTFDSSTLLM